MIDETNASNIKEKKDIIMTDEQKKHQFEVASGLSIDAKKIRNAVDKASDAASEDAEATGLLLLSMIQGSNITPPLKPLHLPLSIRWPIQALRLKTESYVIRVFLQLKSQH